VAKRRPRATSAFAYDGAGRKILEERYAMGGGRQNKTTWAYDDAGHLLDYREYYGDQLAVQSVCEHDVQDGRLMRVTCDGGPGGPDGAPETVDDYTYDAAGNVLTVSSDGEPPFEAPDGTPDSVMTYTYDDAGRRTRESLDSDANGTADRIVTHEFDAGGHDVGLTRDQNGDGVPELTETRVYDASDRLTDETWDQDGDGRGRADAPHHLRRRRPRHRGHHRRPRALRRRDPRRPARRPTTPRAAST
jgi:hypothetical protein